MDDFRRVVLSPLLQRALEQALFRLLVRELEMEDD